LGFAHLRAGELPSRRWGHFNRYGIRRPARLLLPDESKLTVHEMHIFCPDVIHDCYVQRLVKLNIDPSLDDTPPQIARVIESVTERSEVDGGRYMRSQPV